MSLVFMWLKNKFYFILLSFLVFIFLFLGIYFYVEKENNVVDSVVNNAPQSMSGEFEKSIGRLNYIDNKEISFEDFKSVEKNFLVEKFNSISSEFDDDGYLGDNTEMDIELLEFVSGFTDFTNFSGDEETIARYALEKINQAAGDEKLQWLELLSYKKISSSNLREQLFYELQRIEQPEMISVGLSAIVPLSVSVGEKAEVMKSLSQYANHTDPLVRSAGVKAISLWAGNDDSDFIEKALYDNSAIVRQSAIAAIGNSGVYSSDVKNKLFTIMDNGSEDWSIRIDAYQVLSSYTLSDEEALRREKFKLSR